MTGDITNPEQEEPRAVTPAQALKIYERIIRRGEAAWQDWLTLGNWIGERREIARAKANGATKGSNYTHHLERQFGTFYPTLQKLNGNGTVTALDKCIAQIEAVTAWRNRMDESMRPSHPQRVWKAFEESQRSTIAFEDEGENDESDDEKEERAQREGRRGKGHNTEKELLAEIEALRERLDGYTMTGDPDINADRIWRRITEVVGHGPAAAKLAQATGSVLMGIGTAILDDESEWAGKQEG